MGLNTTPLATYDPQSGKLQQLYNGDETTPCQWPVAQQSELTQVPYLAAITLDAASVSNHINIGTLTGNLTLNNPTGFTAACTLNVWLTQDATGSRLLTLGSKIKASGGAATITLSTGAGSVDFLALSYNPSKDIWIASILKGVS